MELGPWVGSPFFMDGDGAWGVCVWDVLSPAVVVLVWEGCPLCPRGVSGRMGVWVPCSVSSKMLLKYFVCVQWVGCCQGVSDGLVAFMLLRWSTVLFPCWKPLSFSEVSWDKTSLKKSLNCFWEPGHCSVTCKQLLLRGRKSHWSWLLYVTEQMPFPSSASTGRRPKSEIKGLEWLKNSQQVPLNKCKSFVLL